MPSSRSSEVSLVDEDDRGLSRLQAASQPSTISPPAKALVEQLERLAVDGVEALDEAVNEVGVERLREQAGPRDRPESLHRVEIPLQLWTRAHGQADHEARPRTLNKNDLSQW